MMIAACDLTARRCGEDPERFGAEYLCRWRDDLSSWLDRPLLEAAVDIGVVVRLPQAGIIYTAGCDASGGKNDSFTAAIAHRDKAARMFLMQHLRARGISARRVYNPRLRRPNNNKYTCISTVSYAH
jgi:hypothetical protein